MNVGAAAQLEARENGPLDAEGVARAVEAGWLFPGGSLFRFELGLRGAVIDGRGRKEHELGVFGGARLHVFRDRPALEPYLRGGLGAAQVRLDETRFGLGPYLGLGMSWEIGPGIALAFEATGHARIAPFTLALGGAVTLLVEEW